MNVNTTQIYNDVTYIGVAFPDAYSWGPLEAQVIETIKDSISSKFKGQRNLFVNGTWFSPTMGVGVYEEVAAMEEKFDNVFFLTSVDPTKMSVLDLTKLFRKLGNPNIHFLGNFDHSKYEFSFIGWAISDKFQEYNTEDLVLKKIKYKFINYNRKPAPHRVELVKAITKEGLDKGNIVTLGKSTETYYNQNDFFLGINEKNEDFVETGHWFALDDKGNDYGVPHDLLSLGNMQYWDYHFLNVVSETEFFPWDPIFVTEKTFKPIIGLRPFLINGNVRTYKWLRKYGFKTFNHYFPFSDLENLHEDNVTPNIVKVLSYLDKQTENELLDMYNDMLPDLIYNRERMQEFSKEQKQKIDDLF
jgi:hypothetical protein